MSATLNWIAWCAPICLPNASRCSAYVTLSSRQPCARPTDERGDADPPVREDREALREPAPSLAQQVLLRDAALAERQLVRVARPPSELAVRRGGLEPGRVRRHDDRRDAVRPARRLGRRGDDVERGDRGAGVRDERLRAVDDPVAVLEASRRVDLAPRRSRRRAPSSANPPSASPRRERREPALLLLVGPEPVQQVAGEPDRRRQRDRDRLVDPPELLERETHRDRVGVGAPVRLGERQPEQPEVAHLLHHVERELLLPVGLGRPRLDDLFGELADDAAERLLLRSQVEVHACRKPSMSRMDPVRSVVTTASTRAPICHGPSPSSRCIRTVSAPSSLTRPIVTGASSGSPSMPT